MAGSADLVDGDQHRITVAVQCDAADPLPVPGGVALAPVLLSAAAPEGDPDLLVLDEATSAVDPATEVRLQRALDGVSQGRTSVAIAHRLSTAEASDLVVVVDAGEVVDVGPHADLLDRCEVYRRMYASWMAGTSSG